MNANLPITKDYFIKRLSDLCLKSGLAGFPKDELDQHILLKSAVLMMNQSEALTEKAVNERLQLWILQVSQIKMFDAVTLRRYLVDGGYLTRNKDGSAYQVAVPGPGARYFDPAVDQIDAPAAIEAAREEIVRRKREYLEKQNNKK